MKLKLTVYSIFFSSVLGFTQELDPSTMFFYSTVRITASTLNYPEEGINEGTNIGTAFFFTFDFDSLGVVPCLVTNKHIVENSYFGTFLMKKKNSDGSPDNNNPFFISMDNFEENWIPHPDSTVDLCIMPIAPIEKKAQSENVTLYYTMFGEGDILSESDLNKMNAIETVYMIGYPGGYWDKYNNLPIVRKGETAFPPFYNFEKKAEHLINIPLYLGSSGSPVVLYDRFNFDASGTANFNQRVYLMGINYAGPFFLDKIDSELKIEESVYQVSSSTRIPMHLANVIQSKKILDFKEILLKEIQTNKL